jgi:hypothetical protein
MTSAAIQKATRSSQKTIPPMYQAPGLMSISRLVDEEITGNKETMFRRIFTVCCLSQTASFSDW